MPSLGSRVRGTRRTRLPPRSHSPAPAAARGLRRRPSAAAGCRHATERRVQGTGQLVRACSCPQSGSPFRTRPSARSYSSGRGALINLNRRRARRGAGPSQLQLRVERLGVCGASAISCPSAAGRSERPSTSLRRAKPGVIEQRRQHVDRSRAIVRDTRPAGMPGPAIIHGTRSVASYTKTPCVPSPCSPRLSP